jgi:hypothetical protein
MIYEICKMVAECSDKEYAKAIVYAGWVQVEKGLASSDASDLMAICGSRNGVFFMNAPIIFRMLDNLKDYLDQEHTLQALNKKGIAQLHMHSYMHCH